MDNYKVFFKQRSIFLPTHVLSVLRVFISRIRGYNTNKKNCNCQQIGPRDFDEYRRFIPSRVGNDFFLIMCVHAQIKIGI